MKPEIISSWEKNATEWAEVIQNHGIPSRKFTNRAILDAISGLQAQKIADLGCGEGWLTREMTQLGLEAIGFDAIGGLLETAQKKGPETYHQLTFEAIVQGIPLPKTPFGAAIFNFCLYIKDDLGQLLENTMAAIVPNGHIIIQTLHPFFLVQNGFDYKSQWLSDSWKGLPGNFKEGHSWYARTFENWIDLLSSLKHTSFGLTEVINDEGKPISLIIKIKKSA